MLDAVKSHNYSVHICSYDIFGFQCSATVPRLPNMDKCVVWLQSTCHGRLSYTLSVHLCAQDGDDCVCRNMLHGPLVSAKTCQENFVGLAFFLVAGGPWDRVPRFIELLEPTVAMPLTSFVTLNTQHCIFYLLLSVAKVYLSGAGYPGSPGRKAIKRM